jgi:hypothetical protein
MNRLCLIQRQVLAFQRCPDIRLNKYKARGGIRLNARDTFLSTQNLDATLKSHKQKPKYHRLDYLVICLS